MRSIPAVMQTRATVEMARHRCPKCNVAPLGIPNGQAIIMVADSPTGTSEQCVRYRVPSFCRRCGARGNFEIVAVLRRKDNKIVQYSNEELAKIFAEPKHVAV